MDRAAADALATAHENLTKQLLEQSASAGRTYYIALGLLIAGAVALCLPVCVQTNREAISVVQYAAN